MNNMSRKCPIISFCTGIVLIMTKTIYFPRNNRGDEIIFNGKKYSVIREMKYKGRESSEAGFIFRVTGVFKSGSYDKNRRLSAIPIPFIASQPGFISKKWAMDDHGGIMGLYEWDSQKSSRMYRDSFPLKLMKSRVHNDSFECEIE